jgi:DUF971 family protein
VGLQLLLDGHSVRSWNLRPGQEPVHIDVDLTGARHVRLSVDEGPDGAEFDWFHLSGVEVELKQ